jgi:hypothetical protein
MGQGFHGLLAVKYFSPFLLRNRALERPSIEGTLKTCGLPPSMPVPEGATTTFSPHHQTNKTKTS